MFKSVPSSGEIDRLRRKFGGDLPTAVLDMAEGFPINELAIAYDKNTGKAAIVFVVGARIFLVFFRLPNHRTVDGETTPEQHQRLLVQLNQHRSSRNGKWN